MLESDQSAERCSDTSSSCVCVSLRSTLRPPMNGSAARLQFGHAVCRRSALIAWYGLGASKRSLAALAAVAPGALPSALQLPSESRIYDIWRYARSSGESQSISMRMLESVRDDEKMNSIAFPSKGFDDPTEFHHDFPIFRRNGARHRSRADRCV